MTTTYSSAKDIIVDYLSELYKDEANELAWVYEHGGIEAAMNWICNDSGAEIKQVGNKWVRIED